MRVARSGSNVDERLNPRERMIWNRVSASPIQNLWGVKGVSVRTIAQRTWKSVMEDRVFGHAAELGFYFLFALFPTLLCASSILGLAARSAPQIYGKLLNYLAVVIPTSALGTVLRTFNETTAHASSGKITFGLIAAIWSASVGMSAVQDTLNAVYKLVDRRSYIVARLNAIGLTILLIVTVSLCLGAMFGSDLAASWTSRHIADHFAALTAAVVIRAAGWAIAAGFLALSFELAYCWAPDFQKRCWRWISPGIAIALVGWLLASLGLRVYLHFFNNYSVTYGSLGAVIILLTWFYITGLMLLVGAEINSEIEAAAVEVRTQGEQSEDLPVAPAA